MTNFNSKSQPRQAVCKSSSSAKNLNTSENQPYCIPEPRQKLLALYQGQIPENVFLILGNRPEGSLDSTRFGLVHQDDILGKV